MHENAHKVDVSKWKESGATIYGRLAIFRIFRSKADGNSWRAAQRISVIWERPDLCETTLEEDVPVYSVNISGMNI